MNNELLFPYPSRRNLVYASRGMVASSQHLATQAGLEILKKGGNAVDAAIATAMALCVVEPMANGLGGDAFIIVCKDKKLYGLNASGPAPRAISVGAVRAMGYDEMPATGLAPINVPGMVRGWARLSERFGSMPLEEAAAPALSYAEDGFAVSASVAASWASAYARAYTCGKSDPSINGWFDAFAPKGRAPLAGETWTQRDQARTIRMIAKSGAKDFYEGAAAERMDGYMRAIGGFLRGEDLAAYEPEWVDPVSVKFRDHEIWELPPNGQGLVALMALNILNGIALTSRDSVADWHNQIEAIKLAFTDGMRHITDPKHMDVSVENLLSGDLASKRRAMICERAIDPQSVPYMGKDTVYFNAADGDGMMVSFIQSLYESFGSCVTVPGLGVSFQNRGANFTLDERHINVLAPGKRPYHTIIPAFLTKGGEPAGPFGVMGGFMQPQGHLQVAVNMIDYGMNPQAALDAPRWQWHSGRRVLFEHGAPEHIVRGLKQMGHQAEYAPDAGYGRGQVIMRHPLGGYVGATEPRTDGAVLGW